jgi:WD40 repeat protein
MDIPPSLLGHAPYPGLRPFRSDETGIFFGREAQVDALLEKLDHARFLAVIGPSGCGKSSLVRAGMIPALETGLLSRAGVRWRVATMRPGERPLRRLAEALDAASAPGLEPEPEAVAFLHATLRRGPRGLVEILHDTPLPERTNLLLLVDQFEEIFRYRQQGDSDEADAFVALLLATAAQQDVPVYVVITMRSDFLGDCAVFRGLPEAINAGLFLTPRLTREQRREAIIGPAMVFGGQVEPALVNRLLNDTGEELDQLPLLQHVLMRMWTRAHEAVQAYYDTSQPAHAWRDAADLAAGVTLTLDDYEQVGGLAQALSNHADEAYETLDAEQRRIAAVLFRCLSERSPTQRDTRRPVQLGAVAAVAGVPPAQVAAVADVFRQPDRSFITPSADVILYPDTVLDISHESLIRQWQRLNAWADQEAEAAETYRRLAQTARLWKRGQAALWSTPDLENALAWKERERPTSTWAARYGEDFALAMEFLDASEYQRLEEQQREEAARQSKLRQVRRQLALALVGLCIAVGLAFWAMQERQRAGEARNAAEQALAATTQARAEAERDRAHAERSAQAEAGARSEAEKRQTEAESARAQAEQHRRAAIVQVLVAQALRRQDERGALLARQAYLFNEQGRGRALPQIDAALRAVLDTRYFSHTLHFPASTQFLNSADKQKLVVIDSDGTLQLWDLRQLNATPTVLRGPEKLQFDFSSLHPDGQTLATVYLDPTKLGPHGFGGQVLIWDLRQPQASPTVLGDDTQRFMSVKFSPDGQTLAAGTVDVQMSRGPDRQQSRVFLWSWGQPGTAPTVLDVPGSFVVPFLEFSPDSQTLAAISPSPSTAALGGRAGTLRLWDVRHPEAAPTVFGSAEDLVVSVVLSDDGHTLVTRHTESQKLSVVGMDFQKLGWQLFGSTIQVRDLQQRAANPLVLRSPEAFFSSMDLSPDGQTLATGSNTGSVRLWDLRQPDVPLTVLDTQEVQVGGLTFSPDGNTLISTDQANTLRVWEMLQANPTFTVLRGHTDAVSSVAFSPDGHTLVSGAKDHTVRLWDLRQPDSAPTMLSDYKAPVLSVALSPDGQWLATGGLAEVRAMRTPGFGNVLWLWDLRQPHPTPTILSGPGGPVSTVAFSPNGEWLAATILDIVKASAGNNTGSVRLWDLHQLEATPIVLDIPETLVTAVAFSPDSQHLATSSAGGPVRLWYVHQRDIIRSFPGDSNKVVTLSVAFSPDGQRLAFGDSDGMVRLWDLRQPEAAPVVLSGDGVPVYTVTFSPDNQRLAAGSLNNTARLWNLHQLEVPPIILRGHTGPVFSVAFSPDGQRLATGSHDKTIRLWQVHTTHLADVVCERVWRNLTLDEWRQFIGADIPYERTCPNLPIHPSALEAGQEQTKPGHGGG